MEVADGLTSAVDQKYFHDGVFRGFDSTVSGVTGPEMLVHGMGQPAIRHRDSLTESIAEEVEHHGTNTHDHDVRPRGRPDSS